MVKRKNKQKPLIPIVILVATTVLTVLYFYDAKNKKIFTEKELAQFSKFSISTPTPSQTISYRDDDAGFIVTTPDGFVISKDVPSNPTNSYTIFFNKLLHEDNRLFPYFYISIITASYLNEEHGVYNYWTKSVIDKIFNSPIGASILTREDLTDSQKNDIWHTTKQSNIQLDRKEAIVVEKMGVYDGPVGMHDRRILIRTDNYTFMLGVYYQNQSELDKFNQMLSMFKFTK